MCESWYTEIVFLWFDVVRQCWKLCRYGWLDGWLFGLLRCSGYATTNTGSDDVEQWNVLHVCGVGAGHGGQLQRRQHGHCERRQRHQRTAARTHRSASSLRKSRVRRWSGICRWQQWWYWLFEPPQAEAFMDQVFNVGCRGVTDFSATTSWGRQ